MMTKHEVNRWTQGGQGLGEYILLLLLIAVGIIFIMQLTGTSVQGLYCRAADSISGGAACSAKNYCADDFSGGLSGWNNSTGTWTIQNGKLCTSSYSTLFNSCSQGANLGNYTVTVDGAELSQGNGYGIFFRVTNPGPSFNGYSFQYDPGWNGFIFRKWINGVELSTPIAAVKAPSGYNYNTPHSVQVVVKGSTFTAYIDGVPVLTVTDTTYPTGGVGLRSWDSTLVCFDGITVSP